ncbi:DUF5666 domain-containing protein [Candidatus Deferrimicrobium sp.]|uniref:DUF5666 domain-containing protein n=1 Tax=Candidatus Deferrimicrobium sp. TaxID=3060586 RepID=UPI002ED18740
MNGVKYVDSGIDNTNFFDDHGRTKEDLKTGMMVAIFGPFNGANGTADNITVLRHVDGPMDDNGVDLATNRLKVMGQDIVVDTSTVFDNGVTNLADLQALQGANLHHPELEVHGSADNNGVIHATFINKWTNDNVAGRSVQVRGTVAGLDTVAKLFSIGRETVDYNILGTLPAGMVNGSFVETKGTLRPSDNVLVSTSVRLEDATGGQPSGSKAEVAGYVNRVVTPNASFEMIGPNGVQIVTWTAGTTTFTGGTGTDIVGGVKIEVEGTRKPGGALAATKIEFRRASNIMFKTRVTNPQPLFLTLFGVTVAVNTLTQYEDGSSVNLKTFGQANILAGDTLKVSAFLDNNASIVATRVERIDAIAFDQHTLQGPVGAKANPTLTILGVTVTTTAGGTTFLQADETPFPGLAPLDQQIAFFNAVTPGQTIVKARGQFSLGGVLATEVKIEPTIDN